MQFLRYFIRDKELDARRQIALERLEAIERKYNRQREVLERDEKRAEKIEALYEEYVKQTGKKPEYVVFNLEECDSLLSDMGASMTAIDESSHQWRMWSNLRKAYLLVKAGKEAPDNLHVLYLPYLGESLRVKVADSAVSISLE